MTLIDAERAEALYAAMGPAVEISGGSAANTMVGVASFGGRAAFIGRVARRPARRACSRTTCAPPGVRVRHAAGDRRRCRPGRCLIVVTPDAERTMNTYLGASAELGPSRRRPRRWSRRRAGHVPRGLPLGRARRQGRVSATRPRTAHDAGQPGRAHALRPVLRRAPPRRVPRARRARRRHPVRQRGRDHARSTRSTTSTTRCSACAGHCEIAALTREREGRGDRPRRRGARRRRAPGPGRQARRHDRRRRPLRRRLPATGSPAATTSALCGRLGALAAAEVISHLGARPETTLAELARPLLPGD